MPQGVPAGASRLRPARVKPALYRKQSSTQDNHRTLLGCPIAAARMPTWLGLGDTFRMKRAFVFPGQGSQAVGMGRSLAEAFPAARDLFEEVDEALSQSLARLMFEGPESDLTLTENAQPALLAASLAVIRVL